MESLNIDTTETKSPYSMWGLLIFGPFYLAFKGFLKEAIAFYFVSYSTASLIVEFLINPETEKMSTLIIQIIMVGTNLILALNWDDYVKRWNNTSKSNALSKWINIPLFSASLLLIIFGEILIKDQYHTKLFAEAVGLQKNEKSTDALSIYFKLCSADVPAACLNAGLILYESKMESKALPYFKKACKGEEGQGCYIVGFYHKQNGNFSEEKKYTKMACEYGKMEACNDLVSKNTK